MQYFYNVFMNFGKHQSLSGISGEGQESLSLNIFICVSKMNKCVMGLEKHESE